MSVLNLKISFILPIYNESGNIPRLWQELQDLQSNIIKKFTDDTWSFEYIFVNDASKDNSLKLLKEIYQKNPGSVKIVDFSRNYGHQIAVTAGQDIAGGDAVIIMDTDLQDPPLVCLDLIAKWQEGFDIVYAKRRKYKTNFIKEISAFVFYRLMAKIASVSIPVDTGDFRLLSKRVNLEMGKFREKNRFLRGISSLVGFKSAAVEFDRSERYTGKTGYTFWKSLKLAMDGITSFSLFPIRLVAICGSILSFLSIFFGFLYIFYAVFTRQNVEGWASMMFAVTFIGGVQTLFLGILGEYIGRIYLEVLDRPLYTIAETFDADKITKL